MDPVIAKLIENIPSAGAVIIVVVYFLKAQKDIISQFQQMLADEKKSWASVFEGQREALSLISNHIKQLGELLAQHDGWERENSKATTEALNKIITRKMRTVAKK